MTSNGPAEEAVHGDDQNNVEVASDDLSGNTGDEGEGEDDRIGDSEQSDSLNGSPSPTPSSALPRTSNPSRPLDTNTTNTTPRQSNTQPSTDAISPRTRPQTQTQTRAPYPTQLQTPPPTPQQPQTQTQSQTQSQTQVQNRPQTRARLPRRPRPQSMSYISDSSDTASDTSFFSPSHHLSIAPLDTSHTRTRRLRANVPPNNGPSLTSLKPIKTRPNQAPLLDLQPLSALAPMLNPLPLPPGTAPPRAKLAVQLKMNLEIEVTLKARVCGDVLLTLL